MLAARIWTWLLRVALAAGAAGALLYVGDWAVFAARGGPRGAVTVQRVMVVPLKGNKREYVDEGSADQVCAEALFGQSGLDACWRLRRMPRQEVTY
jgi:hypothetical protein